MNRRWIVFPALLSLALTLAAGAETMALAPTDDMYSDPEHPGAHAPTELWVANYTGAGQYQRIMIRFDVSAIEAPEIHHATLNLYRFFVCPADPYTLTDIYAICQPWDELTWPGNQHIGYDPFIWASMAFGPQNPSWYIVDVTELVRAWVAGETENYGLLIMARGGEKWSKFYSKEYANPDLRPYLEVEYTSTAVEEQEEDLVFRVSCAGPVLGGATFDYDLPGAGRVMLTIHDVSGRRIRTLVDVEQAAGHHQQAWNGRDDRNGQVPAGIYLCALRTPDGWATRKTSLVR